MGRGGAGRGAAAEEEMGRGGVAGSVAAREGGGGRGRGELAEEEMAAEEQDFAEYISDWESTWGSRCGFFCDMSE